MSINKQLYNLPLSILLLVFCLAKKESTMDGYDMAQYSIMLADLVGILRVPHGWLETWLTKQLLTWIYREQGRISQLVSLNIMVMGVLR